MKIRLTTVNRMMSKTLGTVLIDPDCIESVEIIHGQKFSTVRMKAVVTGYDDEDAHILIQHELTVKETVDEIETLIADAS